MPTTLKTAMARLMAASGREPHPYGQYGINRHDFGEGDRAAFEAVRGLTMTSPERVVALRDCVKYVVRNEIAGAFVECGVWRGGSAMVAASTLLECGEDTRDFYLYDTFEGMPMPGELDRRYDGTPAIETYQAHKDGGGGGWAYAGIDEVDANLRSTGYPRDRMRLIKGEVERTLPEALPDRVAILRLDTDFYSSTKQELAHLYKRVSPGGILMIDDYGYWSGAKLAVDEFMEERGAELFLQRVDSVARLAVVP